MGAFVSRAIKNALVEASLFSRDVLGTFILRRMCFRGAFTLYWCFHEACTPLVWAVCGYL